MQSFNFGYFKKDLNRKSIIKKRRTILNKYIAWQLNKEYYDGKRINGYGGFSYDGRWKKFPVEGNDKIDQMILINLFNNLTKKT